MPEFECKKEKRKKQTEIENKRRQLDDDRRQLQHLKVNVNTFRTGVLSLELDIWLVHSFIPLFSVNAVTAQRMPFMKFPDAFPGNIKPLLVILLALNVHSLEMMENDTVCLPQESHLTQFLTAADKSYTAKTQALVSKKENCLTFCLASKIIL